MRWLCLLALTLVGCDSDGLVAVDLITDFAPGVEFDSVDVTVGPELGLRVHAAEPSDVTVTARRVAEFEGAAPGRYDVLVELRSRGRRVASQSLVVTLERSLVVSVIIPRTCEGLECESSETCVRGRCAPIECATGDEPTCPPPECTADGDCAPRSACSTARCVEGNCLASVESACGSGLVCSASAGCVSAGPGDAGVGDAGPPDGGSSPRAACCTAWCRDDDRFGGPTLASEAFTASAPGCSSSTGCTCAVSAAIATSWTIVTGDVCDAHDFATECPASGCDGSQCPEVRIDGRYDSGSGACTCVGSGPTGGSQDVWSSECAENVDAVPFEVACPG